MISRRHALAAAVLALAALPTSCDLLQTEPDVVAEVVVTPASPTLRVVRAALQLSAEARTSRGRVLSGQAFTWTSSDSATIHVTASGLVTALAWGSATITATTGGISGTATVTASPPAQSGTSRVILSDAPWPYDSVARVDLYIVSVSASLSPDTGSAGGFVTMAEPHSRIDLLALQNGVTAELGSVTLPKGVITAVRMVIDTDSSSITLRDGRVLTGSSRPGIAWQSSAGRPVLNALVHENIAVPDSGAIVVIDYDVADAFIPAQDVEGNTDSGFVFSPVLWALDARKTGAIAGVVRAQSADGPPVSYASLRLYWGWWSEPFPEMQEPNWLQTATARTDSTGAFRFAFVRRDMLWHPWASVNGAYIVAVDPPRGSGLGRDFAANLVVTPGAVTSAGTIILH